MTEAEWLVSNDPEAMIRAVRDRASDRRLRLFGVAACSLVGDPGDRVRVAHEVAARFAEGQVGVPEVRRWWGGPATPHDLTWPERAAEWAGDLAAASRSGAPDYPSPERLCLVVREIFGNPFRPATPDPAWLTSTVVELARGAYADRAFDRLPILADALQDAGCDADDVLAHCRDPHLTHVRGCWVLDLLLGKT